jgi:molybdopterin-guanine dinucleotide biosynthesis protein B
VGTPRIVSIIGKKGTGKTSVLVALAAEFRRRGKRVMTLKHATHPARVDTEGTDSHSHYHDGKADAVLLDAPGDLIMIRRNTETNDPVLLVDRYLADADIVLAEGYSQAAIPKIEVYRPEVQAVPLYNRDSADADSWIAIMTDDHTFTAQCPVFRFSDTMWLVALTNLAWDKALIPTQ